MAPATMREPAITAHVPLGTSTVVTMATTVTTPTSSTQVQSPGGVTSQVQVQVDICTVKWPLFGTRAEGCK